ncbi:MAG: outer membrane beta-barrel protein [Spirochaetales bacterium]|nr:outer membrane beta-barrel protein [Spirochaetales bacterium]
MKQRYFYILFIFCVLIISGYSQEPGEFSLNLSPGGILPFPVTIGDATDDYFSIGGGIGLKGEYVLPETPFVIVGGGLDYVLAPSNEAVTTLNTSFSYLSLTGRGGVIFEVIPNIYFDIIGSAGYYLIFGEGSVGSGPSFGGEAGIAFRLNKNLSIGVNGSYTNYWNFNQESPGFHGVGINIGARFSFAGQKETNLEIKDIEFYPVFPVFYKYYDENPIGEIVIKNNEKGPIKDVKVSFYIKQYMDQPKLCTTIPELKDKEEKKVSIYSLFTDNVLGITEGTKVLAEIQTEYKYRDEKQTGKLVESITIQNRNAMTWDDDNKAAAFVTAKDPAILRFSKNIAGATRDKGSKAINTNFRFAFALFEALRIYNVNYVIDPSTPFAEFSKAKVSVDFLQFPRQTLEYKAGDCDDLSILYCSLLEAIGIETSFITIPGHIFMAFSTNIPDIQGRKLFNNPEDLIFHEGTTWVPVEITMIQKGFLKAWETGAKEWRDGEAKKTTGFFPIHEAWKRYEPVGYAKDDKELAEPDYAKMTALYVTEIDNFTEKQISGRVNELTAAIKKSNSPEKLINQLGVLYAKYGLLDKAEKEFLRIIKSKDNFSAIINLANIYYIKGDYLKAIDYYTMAYKQKSKHAVVLIGLAKAHYELENYGSVKKVFAELEAVSPDLAKKYAYLASKDEGEGRAYSQALKEEVEWDD